MKKNVNNIMAVMSKKNRLNRVGQSFPKEFCYGLNFLPNFSFSDNLIEKDIDFKYSILERLKNFKKFKFSKEKAQKIFSKVKDDHKLISFTDFDSFNLGYYNDNNLKLICGFHRAFETLKEYNFDKRFEISLRKIYKIFFFGEKDQEETENLFPFIKSKSKLFKFGVDTDYWSTSVRIQEPKYDLFCIGSDTFRDYEILKKLDKNLRIKLVTKLNIQNLPSNIDLSIGSLNKSNLSDYEIKEIYNNSKIVLVPLKKTTQPSGYSVTLQSMSLGKAVILADIEGLWDRNLLIDNQNIVLYKPGNFEELHKKIKFLLNDKKFRERIESNAFTTARNSFSLDRMSDSLLEIIKDD